MGRLLGGNCPDPVRIRVERDPALRRLIRSAHAYLLAELAEPYSQKLSSLRMLRMMSRKKWHLFRLGRGIRYRLGSIAPMLWSPHDAEFVRLPIALAPLYVLLRPLFWILRRIRRAGESDGQ